MILYIYSYHGLASLDKGDSLLFFYLVALLLDVSLSLSFSLYFSLLR